MGLGGHPRWDGVPGTSFPARFQRTSSSNIIIIIMIRQTADLMVTSGLSKMGYTYLNLDDCWHVGREKKSGKIRVDG
jgi:hypothetical protein